MDPAAPPHSEFNDHVVRFFTARPYLIAVVTALVMLLIWDDGRQLFDNDGAHGWLNWVVIGFAAYAVVASFVLVPRSVAPKMQEKGDEGRLLSMQWVLANSPFLIGFGVWAAGGDAWAATLALGVTIAMLFANARATAVRRRAHT